MDYEAGLKGYNKKYINKIHFKLLSLHFLKLYLFGKLILTFLLYTINLKINEINNRNEG